VQAGLGDAEIAGRIHQADFAPLLVSGQLPDQAAHSDGELLVVDETVRPLDQQGVFRGEQL
jgi:hypothetical protein